MAVEYRLTLAGDIPLEQVAELAAPEAVETSTASGGRMLSADLNDERGYVVDITGGRHGYYSAEDDGGALWEWEPKTYVDVSFYMRKDTLADKGKTHMLAAVARTLAGRAEDAALTLNGDVLMLTRVAGTLRKHNTDGWYDEDYDRILHP
ncbi:SitI3 family protein [Salinispora mooreana]|uniref:SitI3 family protein n=1 Tax=Salinispora mooreana TaxID=999545 RepID=UPI0003A25054|nr:SitI3 family protein [Salinispora mooreana]